MANYGKYYIAVWLLLLRQYLEVVCPEAAHKAGKGRDRGPGGVKIGKHILAGVASRDVLSSFVTCCELLFGILICEILIL